MNNPARLADPSLKDIGKFLMFEKRTPNKPEPTSPQSQQDTSAKSASTPSSSGRAAVIGPGIHINGDISGDENLLVEGKVDGKIRLGSNHVEIGQSGQVNADINAKVIKIAGHVRGDLNGTEKVIILRSGNVHGNIVAPRMTLEDGAIFKGSIDMDPGEPVKTQAAKPVKKPVEKAAETPKVVATDKAKESNGYSLHGG
jgi:cytoskeletal protein CcmA (bactofilin family)